MTEATLTNSTLISDLAMVKSNSAKETIGDKQFTDWNNPVGYYLIRGLFTTNNCEYRLPKMGTLGLDTVNRKCFYKTVRHANATQRNFNTNDLDYFLLFIDDIMTNEQGNKRIVGDAGDCELYAYNGQLNVFDMKNEEYILPARMEVRVIYDLLTDNITNASIKISPIGRLSAEAESKVIALKARLAI